MITKLVYLFTIVLVLLGCRNRDIRASHLITDLSRPTTLTFKLRSGSGDAGYRIIGQMNGTLGHSDGLLMKGISPHIYSVSTNLNNLDTALIKKYIVVHSDSIVTESSSSIGQGGQTYVLYFVPGTATQGKIEVEFWEHPTGIY